MHKRKCCFWAFKYPRKHLRISSVEEEVSALTKVPNGKVLRMKSIPLSKSAEYAQLHREGSALLPPLILTSTGLQDRKQMFSFENLKDVCGQATLREFFMDPDETSFSGTCSCVTLDEYLDYTQTLKSLSSPSPSQLTARPATSSALDAVNSNANSNNNNNSSTSSTTTSEMSVDANSNATSTPDQTDELANKTLYAKNVICLSSWRAVINECFSNTPFSFNSPHNLFNSLPKEKQVPTNNITLDIGVPGTGFSPSFDLGYRVCACLQQEDNGCGLWICAQPSEIDKALLCDTLMSITPDDPLVFRKLDALAKAATFPIYVGTVKEGDAVVIPPGSVFANINFGGRFSRAMWDVFTPRSVEYALMRLAPLCRAIGAVEVFEMKAMAYYGLLGAWERLQKENDPAEKCVVLKDVAALVRALEVIVREDTADAAVQPAQCPEKNGEKKVCQRCGCNLFSRGYQCSKCAAEDPLDGYVCIECVAEGRDCGNSYHSIKDLTLMEFFPLVECTNILDLAVVAYKTAINDKTPEVQRGMMMELVPQMDYSSRTLLEISDLQVKRSSGDSVQCHSCGELVSNTLLSVCSNKDCKCSGYCNSCLQKMFRVSILDTLRDPKWVCHFCKKSCHCPTCSPPEKQKIEESPQSRDSKSSSRTRTPTKLESAAAAAPSLMTATKSAPCFGESITPPSSPSTVSQPQPPPANYQEQPQYPYVYGSSQGMQGGEELPQKLRKSSSRSSSASSSSSSRSSSGSSSSLSSSSSSDGSMSPRSRSRHGHHHHRSDNHHHRHGSHRRQYGQSQSAKYSHHHSSSQRSFVHPLTASTSSLAVFVPPVPQIQQSMSAQELRQDLVSSAGSIQQISQHHHHYHTQHHDKKRTRSRSRSSSKSRHGSSVSLTSSANSSSSSLSMTSSGALSPSKRFERDEFYNETYKIIRKELEPGLENGTIQRKVFEHILTTMTQNVINKEKSHVMDSKTVNSIKSYCARAMKTFESSKRSQKH